MRLLLVILGAALALLGGFVNDFYSRRRRVTSTGKLLLFELQRLNENQDLIDDANYQAQLRTSVTEYKQAIFAADALSFNRHWEIVRELHLEILDKHGTSTKSIFRLLLLTRLRLAKIMGEDAPGSAETMGVPETGPPIRNEPPRSDA